MKVAAEPEMCATSRRNFLRGAATIVASSLATSMRGAGQPSPSIPVIDTHVHYYDPSRPQGVPFPSPKLTALYQPFLPPQLEKIAAGFNVLGTVVLEASPWVEDNQWILDLAADHPSIVGFVGSLRPTAADFAGNLRRFAANPLFRGLRLSSEDLKQEGHADFDSGLRLLVDGGLAVDVAGRSIILAPVLRMAKRWPELRIVVNHMPFAEHEGDPVLIRRSLAPISDLPNVYLKVSSFVRKVGGEVVVKAGDYRPAFDELLGMVGPNRLVFGSNWPVSNLVAPYATGIGIAAEYFASKSRDVAEGFFWRNSYAAYRWISRGKATALAP